MNTACPTCGAVYNVAAKDIGRKLKCKKCSTALKVTEDGLELDGGTGAAAPASDPKSAPASAAVEGDEDDYEDEAPRKKKKGKSYDRERERDREPRANPFAALGGVFTAVGGLPTLLFGFGVFLVIVFTAFPIIGAAGTDRAAANVDKLKLEQRQKVEGLAPKGKKESEYTDADKTKMIEEMKKIVEEYDKKFTEAALDAEYARISNRREVWLEMYGLMFGFIFVAFGCVGYLRTEQPLVLKIVAGVILAIMMLVMFLKFGGCDSKSSSPPPSSSPAPSIPSGPAPKGKGGFPIE